MPQLQSKVSVPSSMSINYQELFSWGGALYAPAHFMLTSLILYSSFAGIHSCRSSCTHSPASRRLVFVVYHPVIWFCCSPHPFLFCRINWHFASENLRSQGVNIVNYHRGSMRVSDFMQRIVFSMEKFTVILVWHPWVSSNMGCVMPGAE